MTNLIETYQRRINQMDLQIKQATDKISEMAKSQDRPMGTEAWIQATANWNRYRDHAAAKKEAYQEILRDLEQEAFMASMPTEQEVYNFFYNYERERAQKAYEGFETLGMEEDAIDYFSDEYLPSQETPEELEAFTDYIYELAHKYHGRK